MIEFTTVDLPPDHHVPKAPEKLDLLPLTPEQFALRLAGFPCHINPETPSGYADLRDEQGYIVKRVSLGRLA